MEKEKFFDYFPDFANYHSRYDILKEEDFKYTIKEKEELAAFKGYTPYMNKVDLQKPEIYTEERNGLTVKSEKYLKMIIEYAKENDIQLVFIVVPYMITEEDKKTYNQIMDIVLENNMVFIDYNEYYGTIGLDFSCDLNDESHLNYWGSSKFTRYLGEFLSGYDLADHRGKEEYKSWDENVKLIKEYTVQFE